MPGSPGFGLNDTRERTFGLVAAMLVQVVLVLVLLSGLRVSMTRARDAVVQLVEVPLQALPQPPAPRLKPKARKKPAAPSPARSSSSKPAPAPPASRVAVRAASPAPASGGASSGAGAGAGRGVGAGEGEGEGDGDGGSDLVQVAGEIYPSDYPRNLRDARIGGRVGVLFDVGPSGRVTRCTVTRSSGTPQLDALTCRLIQDRFRYRPSTDERGRPIADEVEGEHDWVARRNY